jgi:thiamine biosynthesis lipoprotein
MFSPYRADSVLRRFAGGEVDLTTTPADFRTVLALARQARDKTAGAFDVHASGWLDPSGIVKGWAAERASWLLPADSYLNAGGDLAIRSPGEPWRIGIEHPADPTGLLTVLRVCHGGVATSGSVHRGPHIIDPTTGAAASGIRQATVIGPSLTWADIWATAIVAAGNRALNAGSAVITRCLADGYDALLVSDDGSTWITAGFGTHIAPDTPAPPARPLG